MMEAFSDAGYVGLFVSAFLAATLLPLSSELVLSVLLLNGLPPVWLVLVATAGNVLGSLANYGLGYWAGHRLLKRGLRYSEDQLARAETRFRRYGIGSLCLAWVPVIGDPITVVAGVLRIPFHWFVLLVTLGKCGRYLVLSYLVLAVD